MAQLVASIHVWDLLDKIQVTAIVRTYDPFDPDPQEEKSAFSVQLEGEGISDHRQWLRDALVGLAETL